jgi:hypothetical protein
MDDRADDHQRLDPSGHVLERFVFAVQGIGRLRPAEGQKRDHREQRDHREVLEQQHGEARPAAFGPREVLLVQRLHHYGGRGQRQDDADRERLVPRQAERRRHHGDRAEGQADLEPAEADQPVAHVPEHPGFHLEPDDEQHQHHAVFGVVLHVAGLGADEAEHRADGISPAAR